MKQLLTTAATAILITPMAFAAPSTGDIKWACMESGKTIWVESTQACVPLNPCTDTSGKYEAYCNRYFSTKPLYYTKTTGYVPPRSILKTTFVLETFLRDTDWPTYTFDGQTHPRFNITKGSDCGDTSNCKSALDGRYLAITLNMGNGEAERYLVFEFASLSDDSDESFADALCYAIGGNSHLSNDKGIMECSGVPGVRCMLIAGVDDYGTCSFDIHMFNEKSDND